MVAAAAISGAVLAAIGAFLTGLAGIITALVALRRAKADERRTADADCNERLVEMLDRELRKGEPE